MMNMKLLAVVTPLPIYHAPSVDNYDDPSSIPTYVTSRSLSRALGVNLFRFGLYSFRIIILCMLNLIKQAKLNFY